MKTEEFQEEIEIENGEDVGEDVEHDEDIDWDDCDGDALCLAPTHSMPAPPTPEISKRKMPDQSASMPAEQPKPAAKPGPSPKKLKQDGNPGTTEEECAQYKLCNICGHWLHVKLFPRVGSTCQEGDLARERIQRLVQLLRCPLWQIPSDAVGLLDDGVRGS